VDGITFASKAEARRYQELQMLVLAGEVSALVLQVPFALTVPTPGAEVEIGVYVADFCYRSKRDGYVVEDVKGFKTPLYRWKKKHFEAQYDITILETQ